MIPLSVVWDADPVAFSIGSLEIAWYGVLWAAALLGALWIFARMVKREGLDPRLVDSLTELARVTVRHAGKELTELFR